MANELVRVDVSKYAIMTGPSARIVRENLAGDQITAGDLPRIKVPTAGAAFWQLPDGSPAQTFEGIIIYSALQKARWESNEPTPGTPPACFGRVNSQTGEWLGVGNPGGDCVRCIYNVFGSEIKADGSQGRGKACGDKRICLIVTPTSLLPVVMYIPATSLQNFKRFLLGLDDRYQHIVTRFELTQDKNATGIVYSKIAPFKVSNVPPEVIPQVDDMVKNMSVLFQQIMAAPPAEDAE